MAVVKSTIEIEGNLYDYTVSDAGRYLISATGAQYESVIDPLNSNRVYTEGELIPVEGEDYERILSILMGDE